MARTATRARRPEGRRPRKIGRKAAPRHPGARRGAGSCRCPVPRKEMLRLHRSMRLPGRDAADRAPAPGRRGPSSSAGRGRAEAARPAAMPEPWTLHVGAAAATRHGPSFLGRGWYAPRSPRSVVRAATGADSHRPAVRRPARLPPRRGGRPGHPRLQVAAALRPSSGEQPFSPPPRDRRGRACTAPSAPVPA